MSRTEELLDRLDTNYLSRSLYPEAWQIIDGAVYAAKLEGMASIAKDVHGIFTDEEAGEETA